MWDYDSLYNKAKSFVRKGLDHEAPTSDEIPLWCILSLELLARATLSRTSPVLLADPKDEKNILFAVGFIGKKAPTSLPSNIVFSRCMTLCEQFSKEEYERCIEWMNLRNEELHTGHKPFGALKTSAWLPHFFRICSILIEHNKAEFDDFFGPRHAAQGKLMIESLSRDGWETAHALVREAKERFEEIEASERLKRMTEANDRLENFLKSNNGAKEVKCPSCGGKAFVVGELVRSTNAKEEGGELIQDDVWLPTLLGCPCCKLKIESHSLVAALGFGDQFVTKDLLDPIEYFDIEIDPSDFFEPQY